MENHIKVSIILWCLVLIMGLVIGLSFIMEVNYVDNTTTLSSVNELEDIDDVNDLDNSPQIDNIENEKTIIDINRMKLSIDENYHMNLYINSGNQNIYIDNDENSSNIKIESEMIDNNMRSTATSGLCIAGLTSDNSPTTIDFEDENTINTSVDLSKSQSDEIHVGENVQEIVDMCADS